MRNKKYAWLALLAALTLVASACKKDKPPVAGGGDGECPDAEFGCVEVAAGDPVVIGTLLVISGENASLGQDSQNGAVLAVDFRDTPGEVLGHAIEFNHQDDGCSAEGGQTGAQALASDTTVAAVVGTSCSSSALGVADKILSDKGILLISPSNTGPALTHPDSHEPFYLRTAHNDKMQGAAVADFAYNEIGAKTAATIHDGSPYADGLQQVFVDNFTAAGGTITKQEAVQSGDTDFKPLLTDIATDKPDFLYYPIFVAEGGLITSQAREIDGLSDLAGSDGMFTPDWIEAAGADNAEGVYISGPNVAAFQGGDFYKSDFLPAYSEKFGEEPQSVFHAHAFDAMNLILDAIEEVALETDDGGLQISRTALKDALFATTGYEGITGNLSCDENGDCQQVAIMAVHQVKDGDFGDPIFEKEYTLSEL